MTRHNFFLVISLVAASTSFPIDGSAQVINGIVVDKSNKPIPFVSIGIVEGNYGIISKENGNYSLESIKMKSDDTLRILSIGYHSKDYIVREIQNISFLKVILEEYVYPIKEVTIHPGKKETVDFGNKTVHSSGWAFGGKFGTGTELARLFTNSDIVTLKEFQFHIRTNDFDSILFRLNIYSEVNKLPYQIINHSPIFIKSYVKTGWIKHNLLDFNIVLEDDFFVSIEAIMGWGSNEKINSPVVHLILSGKQNKKAVTFNRLQNFGTWRKDDMMLDYFLIAIK